MQRSSNLIILLQSRAASQNLGQPELANGALHMTDLPLRGGGGSNPLRRLTTNTADHVGMGEGLGGALGGLHSLRLGGLGDARVQRRGATGDHQRVLSVTSRSRRTSGKRVERVTHGDGFFLFFFYFCCSSRVFTGLVCVYRCFVSGLLSGVSTTGRECRIAKKDKTIGFRESDRVKNETRIEIDYRVRMLNSASFFSSGSDKRAV